MSCSPFDLKEYFLHELPSPQRVQVEAHVNNCLTCREELEGLDEDGAETLVLARLLVAEHVAEGVCRRSAQIVADCSSVTTSRRPGAAGRQA